jgi:hypothetical protein
VTGNRKRNWIWVKPLRPEEKAAIAVSCEHFIAEMLKPRFLREIRPTAFNYPIDILGRWRGSKYSFITRYRSGFSGNVGEEFDAPFARLDHLEDRADVRFNLMWHRHTGEWRLLHPSVALDKAFRLIETEELLWPVC